MNTKFFMVFVEGGDNPVFKHLSYISAWEEAKRLAKKTKKSTYVLTVVGVFTIPEPEPIWENVI